MRVDDPPPGQEAQIASRPEDARRIPRIIRPERASTRRDVDALLAKAKDHVGIYAERLLGGPLPWTKMRQAYALIALCDKYGDGRVEAICQSALAFDVVSVTRVGKMLKSAAKPSRPETANKVIQIPLPRFVRRTEGYETRSDSTKKEAQ